MGLPVEPHVPALYLQGASKSEIDRPPALLIVKVKLIFYSWSLRGPRNPLIFLDWSR